MATYNFTHDTGDVTTESNASYVDFNIDAAKLKSISDNLRNHGCVAYSEITSATLTVEGDIDTSKNEGTMTVTFGGTQIGSVIEVGGDTGRKSTSGSILSFYNNQNVNSGYLKNSSNTLKVRLDGPTMLIKYTHTCRSVINFGYEKPRAIVSVSKTGEGTVTGAGTYEYGKSYTITATPATGWKFVKWSDGNTSASRTFTVDSSLITAYETQKSYQAVFEKLTYTVTFKDDNGATLKTETVAYGGKPTPPTAPVKPDTAQHKYTFDGWYDSNGNKWTSSTTITGTTTFTARYTSTVQKYTVRWYNYDGTLLETDTDVPYGTKPTYNGETPTKPSDEYYNYGFAGWSPSTDEAIQGDKNFTAQFAQTDRYYTVRWLNASAEAGVEGELLETDEVLFNTQPDYNGTEPVHPLQDTDPEFDYTFIGWAVNVNDPAKPDTELEKVKGNITYTAIYEKTKKLYAITVILFDTQYTEAYEYGTEITIEAPETVDFHRFVKWSDGNTQNSRKITVTGVATYQATYERIPIPVKVNLEQVTGVYIVPTTQTIAYVIDGTIPTVEIDEFEIDTVNGWNFIVLNSAPDNGYALQKLFITDKNGITTRVY